MKIKVMLLSGASGILFATGSALAQSTPPAAVDTTHQPTEATQQPAGASSSDQPNGDIVVTASRIDRPGYTAPTPLRVLDLEDLRLGGRPNVASILNDQPQFKGTSSTQTLASAGTGAISGADLRGLGANRTLVLLDGHRIVSSSNNLATGGAVDLALIPSMLLRRVDVVTGSASAAWGSGAVAGVVNLILDDRFEGYRLAGQVGISGRDDGREVQLSGAAGWAFAGGRAHLVVAGEYVNNDGIRPPSSRPNVGRWVLVSNPVAGQSPFIYAPDGGIAVASPGGLIVSGVNAGRTFNPDGTLRQFNPGRVSGLFAVGGEAPSNEDLFQLTAPVNRYSAFGRLTYDVSDSVTLSAELRYGRLDVSYPRTVDTILGNQSISIDNAFLPTAVRNQMLAQGETSFLLGRFNSDFAQNIIHLDRRNGQGTIAANGRIGPHWRWSAYYSHGEFRDYIDIDRLKITTNFARAVDSIRSPVTGQPVCRVNADASTTNDDPLCVPINLFGAGNASPQALAYVLGTGSKRERQDLDIGAFTIRGEPFELWAGPASLALGAEIRRDANNTTVGALDAVKAFSLTNFGAFRASETTKEAFGEIVIPLVRDVPLLRRFEFNGAARITHDVTGSIWSWKLGATDEVTRGFRLRFTRSRDIRSPSLTELYTSTSLPLGTTIIDPTRPAGQQTYTVFSFSGGNPALQPEISNTTTFGATLEPSLIPNLQLSADFYDIDIHGAIGSVLAQQVITGCANGSAALCNSITRGSNGLITTISTQLVNLASVKARGIDVEANFRLPLSGAGLPGVLRLQSDMSFVTRFRTDNGLAVTDNLGVLGGTFTTGVPKFRMSNTLFYDVDRFQVYVRGSYISPGNRAQRTDIENNRIPGYALFDLGMTYRLIERGRTNVEIYGTINNLFDRDPPFATQFSAYYDVVGRYLSAGARLRF